jgi:DNA-directed RNA polymerase subunit RPC12/RpoP
MLAIKERLRPMPDSAGKVLLFRKIILSKAKLSGAKRYVCTDCQAENFKTDNGKTTVGYCDKCGHPLWN